MFWWSQRVEGLMYEEPFHISGVQRLHRNLTLRIDPAEFFGEYTLDDIGYTQAKMKQLERAYFVAPSVAGAVASINSRVQRNKWGSATITHHGEPKKNVPSDFCMASTTVAYVPRDGCYIDTVWRSMEAIKRGRADFVFLRDRVLSPFAGIFEQWPVREVNFHFHSLTVHPMMMLILADDIDFVQVLKSMQALYGSDHKFRKDILKWFHYYLVDGSTVHKYSSAQQVLNIARRKVPPAKLRAIKRYTRRNYR